MVQARYPQQGAATAALSDVNVFVRQTYTHFILALIGMLLCGSLAYHLIPQQALITFAIVDAILWVVCGWFGWRKPIALVFPLFSVVTGAFLGLVAARYAALGLSHIFINASVVTAVAFVALSLYVHFTRRDFSGLIGFLIVGFWILLLSFVLRFFLDQTWLHAAFSTFGAVVFSAWILFDTSRILNESDPDLTPAIAAFELFLDIIGLHSYILDLFDMGDVIDS